MTGNVLRRLREARGLTLSQVAVCAGINRSTAAELESSRRHAGDSVQRGKCWSRYIKALRKLELAREMMAASSRAREKAHAELQRCNAPIGTTHFLAGEPVRIREYGGKRMGFAWVGEWVRSSRVEDAKCLEVV